MWPCSELVGHREGGAQAKRLSSVRCGSFFSLQALKKVAARDRGDREVIKALSLALEVRLRGIVGFLSLGSRRLEVGLCHAGSGPLGELLVS